MHQIVYMTILLCICTIGASSSIELTNYDLSEIIDRSFVSLTLHHPHAYTMYKTIVKDPFPEIYASLSFSRGVKINETVILKNCAERIMKSAYGIEMLLGVPTCVISNTLLHFIMFQLWRCKFDSLCNSAKRRVLYNKSPLEVLDTINVIHSIVNNIRSVEREDLNKAREIMLFIHQSYRYVAMIILLGNYSKIWEPHQGLKFFDIMERVIEIDMPQIHNTVHRLKMIKYEPQAPKSFYATNVEPDQRVENYTFLNTLQIRDIVRLESGETWHSVLRERTQIEFPVVKPVEEPTISIFSIMRALSDRLLFNLSVDFKVLFKYTAFLALYTTKLLITNVLSMNRVYCCEYLHKLAYATLNGGIRERMYGQLALPLMSSFATESNDFKIAKSQDVSRVGLMHIYDYTSQARDPKSKTKWIKISSALVRSGLIDPPVELDQWARL